MQLPDKKFTGYGTSGQNTALKYFFIVPDRFDPDNISPRKYHDIEEPVSFNTFWTVNFDIPVNSFVESNLPQIQMNSFQGYLDSDPEFSVSFATYPILKTNIDGIDTEIKFGYNLKPEEKQNLEFYLPLHLKFLQERIGSLPKVFSFQINSEPRKISSEMMILHSGNLDSHCLQKLKKQILTISESLPKSSGRKDHC